MRLLWFRAVISCAEGDWRAIAKYLVTDARQQLRRFLLGEVETVRLRIGQNGLEAVYVLNLTQTQWHKLVRLLIGRASFYRRWLLLRPGYSELRPHVPLGLGKTESIGIAPLQTPNDRVERPPTMTVPRPDAARDLPRSAPTRC